MNNKQQQQLSLWDIGNIINGFVVFGGGVVTLMTINLISSHLRKNKKICRSQEVSAITTA